MLVQYLVLGRSPATWRGCAGRPGTSQETEPDGLVH